MHPLTLLILTLTLTLSFFHGYSQPQPLNDAISLLSFKSKADPDNHLVFSPQQDYCEWQGVKCHHSRVVRFYLRNLPLGGTFPPNSLTSLPHLRVLVLSNTSLSGPLPPSLHSLPNLRSLLLPHNSFSSSLPPSLFSLSHLRVLDLSFNRLSSSLSPRFLDLPHLTSLQLQFNHFHGTLPLFNQSSLLLFNVSANNLSGRVPPTSTLSHFPASSFAFNPLLCGELVNKPCHSSSPFFASSSSSSSADQPPNSTASSNNHDDSASLISPPHSKLHRKRRIMILGFSLGGLLLASSSLVLCVFIAAKKKETTKNEDGNHSAVTSEVNSTERQGEVARVRLDSQSKEFVPGGGGQRGGGDLVFCAGEVKLYTLEQLMRGSAEMLGRGMIGTTYKAKLDNQLILTVKRLDATRMSGVDADMFDRHMQTIGAMRHPNLVSVRAYFQAKEERLIIFDYQPNGSVFNLIHGSRSTRAKPLHWTSCLKIAEDVAQGLAYIHQASKLAHGNLKASNVLLGTEFEACVTDYCLSALSASSSCDNEDPDSARYRAPEARNSAWNATSKMDVYAFGVLLLELLSGKPPSQHPFLAPQDMLDWVKSMRGDDDSCEDNNLAMLAEVASLCSLISPEQRPQMWEVLKMIQKIKASVGSGDAMNPTTGYS